ncbi:uncharacterized protein LOC108029580 [Drosophila biarmipes]|uniref:uncharacterized protein LOC108029580 n=1 Tax=Drosophila biarmipes TaxID=125945 RepID=UPI0007E6D626|nr:uncharacterized protein LOC108029580 [Drosophila biarmipes]
MSRLSVLSGLRRSILRSAKNPNYILRCLSDNADTTSTPHPSEETQSNLKKFERAEPVEHTSHMFVLPNVKDRNIHYEELKQESDDDITATWGWKNNELDVEQLAGMPGPSEVEDPYMKIEEGPEDDGSGIQEELQFEKMRSRREKLTKDLHSQEPFASFERNSLTSVRKNVDFMMQELSQISLLLNTLYPEESALVGNSMDQAESTMGKIYSGPEMASWAFNQDKAKNLDHEEESNQPAASELTSSMSDQSGLKEVENYTASGPDDLEPVTAELPHEAEEIDQILNAGDNQESSPSKTTENNPQTHDKQPKEHIHTYRPFRTIEVPVNQPKSDLCLESNEELPFSQEDLSITEHLDNTGYTVSAQLTEPESRLLMRMALKQALNDLESGKSKYKATILEAETE